MFDNVSVTISYTSSLRLSLTANTMTNYLQAKYEALVLNDIPLPTAVKVNRFVTNHPDEFTRKELDDVTAVFKSLETGLRQGTIFPKDLHRALTRLGLNPTDQEIVDIANYIAK